MNDYYNYSHDLTDPNCLRFHLYYSVGSSSNTKMDELLARPDVLTFINLTNNFGIAALHHAAEYGTPEEVSKLLSAGADINNMSETGREYTPLIFVSASENRGAIVRLLINAGADVNKRAGNGTTALMLAVWNRCHENTLMLLEAGADWTIKNKFGEDVFELSKKERGLHDLPEINMIPVLEEFILSRCKPFIDYLNLIMLPELVNIMTSYMCPTVAC